MAATMRAERFYADTKTIVLEDVPIPEPGRGRGARQGRLLRHLPFRPQPDQRHLPRASCRWSPRATRRRAPSPNSVRASPAGPRATGWSSPRAGPASQCRNCRRGDLANCLNIQLMAFAYDGAWAEYTVAAGRRADPGSRQRAAGAGRDPGRRGVDAVRRGRAHRQGRQSASRSGCGVSAASAPTSCSWPGWSARCRSSPSTSTRWCGSGPWNSAPTTPSTPATPDLQEKIAEATGGRMLDVAFDAVGLKVDLRAGAGLPDRRRPAGRGRDERRGPDRRADRRCSACPRSRCSATSATRTPTSRPWPTLVSRGRLDLSRSISADRPAGGRRRGHRECSSTPRATRSGSWCSRSLFAASNVDLLR